VSQERPAQSDAAQSWPTVESLLAHGPRIDHVSNDGLSLRDLLPEAIAGYRGEIPPRIAALRESLREDLASGDGSCMANLR
jgi:hypothetical protein